MTEIYKIADRLISVTSLYPDVHEYCAQYRNKGTPDFSVVITDEDIAYEHERSRRTAEAEGRKPEKYSDAYMEELAVYRKIAEKMPDYDTMLFHGSAVAVDGQAYLFTAKSGTGKSTHTRLWREYLGSRAVMVNDDKPLIRISDGGAVVYGTPYNGKHRLSTDISVPLKCICILERAKENTIERIDKKEAYAMLVQQSYRPGNIDALQKTLQLIDALALNTQLWRLGCNMDISAAKLSYLTMKGC